MQVACCEYLTAVPEVFHAAAASMRLEAAAMLQCVADDLARVPGIDVVVFRGHSVPLAWKPLTFREQQIRSEADLSIQLTRVARDSAFTLVIAPESDGLLSRLLADLQTALHADNLLLNLDAGRSSLFSDKFRTFKWLLQNGLPTIPTQVLSAEAAAVLLPPAAIARSAVSGSDGSGVSHCEAMEFVIKPRDGVGSDRVYRISDVPEVSAAARIWEQLHAPAAGQRSFHSGTCQRMAAKDATGDMLLQPYVAGIACSIGLIGGGSRGPATVLPAAMQWISFRNHRMEYQGGEIPCSTEIQTAVLETAEKLKHAIGPFCGYLGADLLVDLSSSEPVRIVEINPRLCTSYVGYRRLTEENLADRLLQRTTAAPVVWNRGSVQFDLNGAVQFSREASTGSY